jgi:hypothetical protein
MGILGGIIKPMANVAQNAAKADKVKSVKLKVKMKSGAAPKKEDGKQN